MSIKIKNLRISPYQQKDDLKVIFGDQMTVTFEIEHVAGESYACALDNERILYPPNRPVCAYTEAFSRDGDNVTFTLDLRTSKLRDFVSSIRKPMPIWLQVVRGVGGKYETVLLDDVLALPSVIDGSMTVYDGDPIKSLIDAKMDKPQAEGTEGQVLTMDADGHYAWQDLPEIPEQEQADWTETDDTKKSFILHKPELATVATSGSYNDLTDTPNLATVATTGDYADLSNTPNLAAVATSGDYSDLSNTPNLATVATTGDYSDLSNTPSLATVATTGDYGDLTNKPAIPTKTSDLNNDSDFQNSTEVATAIGTAIADKADKATTLAGYGITNAYTKTEVDSKVASVFHYKGSVQTYADLPSTDQEVGDVWNVVTADSTHGIKAGDNLAWTGSGWDVLAGEIDLSAYATKAELATVATTGSYNDLSNKPVIPTQYDWLCLTANEANSTVYIYKYTTSFDLEYSTDGTTWTTYTWDGMTGQTITLANAGDKVYFRGDNADTCDGGISNLYVQFHMSGSIKATGNVMSLLSKTCSKTEIPQFCFYQLFRGCSSLTSANIFGRVKVLSGCGRIFQQCTSLTSIEIPTEVIADHMDMMASAFNGCSSLSRVKVGFHAWFSGTVWLKNVAATGTFICPSDLDCSTRSTSRVPEGWTVERTSAPQADWSESDTSDPSYILNKPTIPAAQVQSDWDESDSSDVSFIKNKPDLSTKLDAPTTAGTVGQVLTKTATGQEWADTVAEEAPDYLCFEALEANSTVALNKVNSPYNPISLETSTDGENWTTYTWNGNAGATITLATIGDKVYWRGDNSVPLSYWYNSTASWHQFATTGKLACSGTVMSLFDKSCKLDEIPTDDAHGGTGLVSLFKDAGIVTPPKLTATKLHNDSYNDMFDGSAIVTPPELPATTLYRNTYAYMFKNCVKLVNAPKLPATTIGEGSYKYMFQNCVSLTNAPYLPAMTLTTECYANMFEGCTSLSEIPAKLPATTLAEKCYSNMFKSCSLLRKPPVLPALTMAMSCYENMFNATDLREVPALPALDLAQQCYGGMFIGCRNLERIPLNYLQATTLQVGCYQWMFVNCTALKVGCRLPATVMASQCYAHMYDGCTSLVDSERINAEALANGCMNQMFKNCTNLTRLWIPNMTAFDESATPAWMSGLSNLKRAFACNANLDTSVRNENRIPTGWIPTRNAYAGDAMVPRWGIYSNNITFAPTNSEQDLITVNQDITLNAIELPYGYVGTAQAFINWTWTNVTLTAGEGIEFVDTPREHYLSRVLVTWDGTGNAKLHVMWETAI